MNSGKGFDRSAPRIVLLAAIAGLLPACAETLGKRATTGAIAGMKQSASDDPAQQPSRIIGARATEGALAALDTPAQRARLERIMSATVAAAATNAVQEATRQMIAELGADGQGPLAASMARTGERVTATIVDSMGSELAALLPECDGPDRMACIDRRLQRTARATAASFTSGVKESVGWQLLLIAFGLGAGGGVLGAWLWSLRHYRRRSLRMA